MNVTDCAVCGAPDAVPIVEDIYCEEGHFDTLYLCRACADRRDGVPTMDEQTMGADGQGRR